MDAAIVISFANILQVFAPCFTAPSMDTFTMLMTGWVLNLRRHTITEVVRAAGAVGSKHISSYHRFFSQASWLMDEGIPRRRQSPSVTCLRHFAVHRGARDFLIRAQALVTCEKE